MATAKYFVIGCLIIFVVGVVLVVIAAGGIFYLGLGKHIDTVEAEGVEFGRKTDQQGCRDEAIRRLKSARRSGDLIRARDAQMFVYGCFQTCRATPGFCRDAPTEDSFFTVRRWAQERCQLEGAPSSDDACVDLFVEVSNSCFGKTKRK